MRNAMIIIDTDGPALDQLKRKIFCENPQRLYGFTVNPADFKA